jgi:hypothetical protein
MLWILLMLSASRVRYSGETAVAVHCENCRRKYYYRLKRSARAEATSKDQARLIAKQRLCRKLDGDIDPVPCPSCGWLQEEMVPLLRTPRLRWMQHLGIATLVIGAIFCIPLFLYFDPTTRPADKPSLPLAVVSGSLVVWGGLSMLTMLGMRSYLNARYDPNDPETEEERIKEGRRRSLTREEADDLRDFVIRRE